YTVVREMKGRELEGWEYEPLFPYFSEEKENGAFRVFTADYVTTEDGTGIVHTAPGFGEDDYNTLKDSEISVVCPLDAEGRFTEEVTDFAGMFVKEADKEIITKLKARGNLVKRDNYLHAYPHCWRCSSPLIYRAISSWFVDIGKVKSKMLDANDRVCWVPDHLKKGRFGKWLENARDWAISRNRYWGNPIPIWRCDSCEATECIGSREDLKEKSGVLLDDLHKHYVDEVTYKCSCGGTMRRVPEVLDCWFESGAMPYAQNHYPFEGKEHFEANFPADFISEGLDQTRGWFYTLTILAAALFDSPAFKNVIVNGLVLAEDGKKMSKSARNYTDPIDIINQYGADALRLFLVYSPVVRAEDLKYSDDGVKEILKSIIIPLWNAYSFFVTYANIDEAAPDTPPEDPENPLDRWILSESERLVHEVVENMDAYDLQKAIAPMVSFIDLLNNWYIRRSRRRFWRSENDADKLQAYETLFSVLMTLVKVAAPIVPFITEDIYRNLRSEHDPESVHLCDYPVPNEARRDSELEKKMATTRTAVSLGRALRSMHNLKNRQPLRAIHLVTRNAEEKRILREMEEIIRDEINVKDVLFRDNEEDLVDYRAKPNFRVLGPVLGKKIKAASAAIEQLSGSEIHSLLEGTVLHLDIEGERLELDAGKVEVQRLERENLKVLNEGSLTVALDSEITEELRREGIIRDLIRAVQNLRKSRGLDVTDRIRVRIAAPEDVLPAVEDFRDYFMNETLTTEVSIEEAIEGGDTALCGDSSVNLALEKSQ
ncbi:MAG: isoleucine--tRNA ligase, partial [Spirochaetota bacterium]